MHDTESHDGTIGGHALLIHSGAVGDLILTLGLMAGLRREEWRVNLLGRPAHGEVARLGGVIGRFWDIEGSGLHRLHADNGGIEQGLARIIKGHGLIVHVSASDRRGGMDAALARVAGGRVVGFDPRPRGGRSGHVTEQWIADMAAAGVRVEPEWESLRWPDGLREEAVARVGWSAGAARVLIHPGSGSARKNWPLENYLALAAGLARDARAEVRFMIGPVERETWAERDVMSLRGAAPVIEGAGLIEAASVIAGADMLIGNDSGMPHLAAALGRGVVAVFRTTRAELWKPRGVRVVALEDPGVETVLDRAAEMMKGTDSRQRLKAAGESGIVGA